MSVEQAIYVDYARHDPAIALVSLFHPIYRGRRPGGLMIEYEYNGAQLHFNIWRALDSRDQSVLLASIGLAAVLDSRSLHADVTSPSGKQLWLDLAPAEQAVLDHAIVVKTTRYTLLQASGLADHGRNYGLLENCLERLSMVGCRAIKDGHDWSMRLLSYKKAADGKLHIALNSRFAQALNDQHVQISLIERRKLKSDTAMLLHAWLSAWLRPGRTNSIGLDRLAEKIWGPASDNKATVRKRRQRVADALQTIAHLDGWQVDWRGRGSSAIAKIRRPTIPKGKSDYRSNRHAIPINPSQSTDQTVTLSQENSL